METMTQPEQEAREVLAAFDHAVSIQIECLHAKSGMYYVIDKSRAEPEVDWPGENLSQIVNFEDAKRIRDEERAKVLLAFATRPTAGIDREGVAKLIREHHAVEYGEDGTWSGTARHIGDYEAADAILSLLPAAAKTGERGAVIEECAAIFEDAISKGYPTPPNKRDQCAHGKYGWEECITCYDEALTEAVAKVRALSQPLPDAPIVSGEGEKG